MDRIGHAEVMVPMRDPDVNSFLGVGFWGPY